MTIEQTTYPAIPVTHWWALRSSLKQRVPAAITPSLLATVLHMQENSARANILPSLVSCGLVDAKGKPTERANRWRDDTQYKKVCEEIRNQVYPQELRDAVSGPDPSSEDAVRWFANKLHVGIPAARRFASVYILVTEADVSKGPQKGTKKPPSKPPKPKSSIKPPVSERPVQKGTSDAGTSKIPHDGPSLHIDVQVHISPEATPEQIDKIFEAMGKHIFKR